MAKRLRRSSAVVALLLALAGAVAGTAAAKVGGHGHGHVPSVDASWSED